MDLLFFDCADDGLPSRVIPIDPAANRSYHYWHVFVPGAAAGQMYGYRVHEPFDHARRNAFRSGQAAARPLDAARRHRRTRWRPHSAG